jgi:hypothetical protein
MPNFALIENNIVKNIIVCDSKEEAEQLFEGTYVECFPDNFPRPGYAYDGENFVSPE